VIAAGTCVASYRALRSLGLLALNNTPRAKPRLFEQIEALASGHAQASAVVVEFGFGALPQGCTQLSLQACARPFHDGVDVRMLTLQVRVTGLDAGRIRTVGRRAIEEFGGTRFIGIEAASSGRIRRRRPADGLDVTVVFPTEFPFFARNVVFVPSLRSVGETAHFADILNELGVEHVREGGMLRAAHTQWRLPLRTDAVLLAFERALGAGYRSAFYSAALPATTSTRLELVRERSELECVLSRGLAAPGGCSRHDLERMEAFVREEFGIELSALHYRVQVMPAFAARVAYRRAR
jgi:hypothetical protein